MNPFRQTRPRVHAIAGCAAAGAAALVLAAAAPAALAAATVATFESQSAAAAAETLVGEHISLVSAELTGGRSVQAATFAGLTLDPAVAEGIALSSGSLRAADPQAASDVDFTSSSLSGPNSKLTTTGDLGGAGSAELTAALGVTTYDAAQLELTVVPAGDTMTIVYQFGSEEYATWAEKGYADAVGIFVDGTLCSLVGDAAAGISSINAGVNADSYVANFDASGPLAAHDTEMNGFSTALTCTATVTPGAETTITAAVADTGDGQLDTTLLLAAGGISSTAPVAPAEPTDPGTGAGAGTGAGSTTGTPASASNSDRGRTGDLARTGFDLDPLALVLSAGAALAVGTGAVVMGLRRRAAHADDDR